VYEREGEKERVCVWAVYFHSSFSH